jgi:tetratricopeptide (TPR) repeat protein
VKKAAIISMIIMLSSCLPLSADGRTKEIINKAKKAVVYVINMDADGKAQSLGTGFFIDRYGSIATNMHVVESADLFIFSVFGLTSTPDYLELESNKQEDGDDVIVVGNPLGLEQTVSTGIISAIRKIEEFGFVYQITAPISPGSSGSPVMNNDGKVIGVATLQANSGQNLNFVVPANYLSNLTQNSAMISFPLWKQRGFAAVPQSAYSLTNLGERFYINGSYKRAGNAALMAIKKYPGYARAYKLAGLAFVQQGNAKAAVSYAEYALKLDPQLYSGHNDLGQIYHKLKIYKRALTEYFNEIRIYPENPNPYYNISEVYITQGNLKNAKEILIQGMGKTRYSASLHAELGYIYAKEGNLDESFKEYKQAIEINPYDTDVYYEAGIVCMRRNDRATAMEILGILKQLNPKMAGKLEEKIKSYGKGG